MISRLTALRLGVGAAAMMPLGARAQTATPAAPVLRVGIEATAETFAEVGFGVDAGIFARAGLQVETPSFSGAGAIAAALAGGSLDIGTIDVILLADAVNRGIPLVAIAGSGLFRAQEAPGALCVAASSPIRNAKGFEGSTIAVATIASLTTLTIRMWLAKNGADPAKVQFIEMRFSEMPAALQRGTIAGAFVIEPMLSQSGGTTLRVVTVPYSVILPVFPISVIITTRAWLAQNGDLARRFVAAVYDTARWANKNRPLTAVTFAKATKIDLNVILHMHHTEFATTLDLGQMQAVLNAAAANKLIDRPTSAASLAARV